MRKSCLAIALLLPQALACRAQVSSPGVFSIDEVEENCIQIPGYPVRIRADECVVVDFGLLAAPDGRAFYFARYQITAPVPVWPSLREAPRAYPNALIVFSGEEHGDTVTVYRSFHEDFSQFSFFSFSVPEVLETARGQVLHVIRRGPGGGMQQWFDDEYWLWQWNDWQQLDVTSWYSQIDSYVPPGHAVGGVSAEHFDLVNLRNVSPVRALGDAMCCASAGIVTVFFDWVDLALAIRQVIYDPHVDFRSLAR